MFRTIHVPVDNSDQSNASIDLALAIGKAFRAKLVGSHVYAAKLHDVRFKQMEFTLPDEYKEGAELEKQRKIHDSLITRGLHLISDSYMDEMASWAEEAGLDFERKHFDGKNFIAIVDDINDCNYDLVILGALGQGAVKESQVGSVCERVLRRTRSNILVVRDTQSADPKGFGDLVVALDGSKASYLGLDIACTLARAFNKKVQIVAVHDPKLEEKSLMEGHLELASRLARQRHDTNASTLLLEGEALAALLAHSETASPWLLLAGRSGIDTADREPELGVTAERLVRHATCNVLLAGQVPEAPAQDLAPTDAIKKAIASAI